MAEGPPVPPVDRRPASAVAATAASSTTEMLSCFANEDLLRDELQRLSLSSSSSTARQLPWDKFAEWLTCVCVVTFDLELGQAMELVYPGHVGLTEKEKTSICYLAFPDSNSGCMGDTRFHFRFRADSGINSEFSFSQVMIVSYCFPFVLVSGFFPFNS